MTFNISWSTTPQDAVIYVFKVFLSFLCLKLIRTLSCVSLYLWVAPQDVFPSLLGQHWQPAWPIGFLMARWLAGPKSSYTDCSLVALLRLCQVPQTACRTLDSIQPRSCHPQARLSTLVIGPRSSLAPKADFRWCKCVRIEQALALRVSH